MKKIVLSSLQGINGTVLMYGQTGSGKTFTMTGPSEERELPQENVTLLETPVRNIRGGDSLSEVHCSKSSLSPIEREKREGLHSLENQTPSFTPLMEKATRWISSKRKVNNFTSPPVERGISADMCEHPERSAQGIKQNEEHNMTEEVDSNKTPCLLELSVKDLFHELQNQPEGKKITLKCSYLEIYNDLVYDLLNSERDFGTPLPVSEDQQVIDRNSFLFDFLLLFIMRDSERVFCQRRSQRNYFIL